VVLHENLAQCQSPNRSWAKPAVEQVAMHLYDWYAMKQNVVLSFRVPREMIAPKHQLWVEEALHQAYKLQEHFTVCCDYYSYYLDNSCVLDPYNHPGDDSDLVVVDCHCNWDAD
jgi:hypothetical protein